MALYVGTPGGKTIHSLSPTAPLAVASAFKLYVLGALAQAVAEGRASWQEQLAISNEHKSLPSGGMGALAAGTRRSLRYFAEQMISVSDNTAADHLIARLGRGAVEKQLVALGNHTATLDEPFLTTREIFALKLAASPRAASRLRKRGQRTPARAPRAGRQTHAAADRCSRVGRSHGSSTVSSGSPPRLI